jgi:hypothetical protein
MPVPGEVPAMPNRQLTAEERDSLATPLLSDVRARLLTLAGDDEALHWALRRKVYKELTYDERGSPMYRRALKAKKRKAQDGLCNVCREALPDRGAHLDRFEAMKGYTEENTQLLCPRCDTGKQRAKGYA